MSAGSAAPKQQLKLKLRQSPVSEANTPRSQGSATPGVLIDNDALIRQQRHVLQSMSGSKPARPESQGKSGTPVPSANPFAGPRGGSASIPPPGKTSGSPPALNGIKQDVQSPALGAIRPSSTAPDGQRLSAPIPHPQPIMAPPHSAVRPPSGSPYPNGVVPQPSMTNGQYQAPTYYVPPSALRMDTFRKEPLKSE